MTFRDHEGALTVDFCSPLLPSMFSRYITLRITPSFVPSFFYFQNLPALQRSHPLALYEVSFPRDGRGLIPLWFQASHYALDMDNAVLHDARGFSNLSCIRCRQQTFLVVQGVHYYCGRLQDQRFVAICLGDNVREISDLSYGLPGNTAVRRWIEW